MIEKIAFPTQQIVNGELVSPPPEICLVAAERVFRERRKKGDTDPKIVQMKSHGELIDHWYYRSKQWIEQPYLKLSEFIQPYIGPADKAPLSFYGDGSYEVDETITQAFRKKYPN